jgi:DNA polymerase-3 subunit alpha
VATIISNRPYSSPRDFLQKVKPGKQAMISLIKGGAFDEMEDRKFTMAWYIWETCDKKSRLTLQNMSALIKHNLLPEKTESQILARRVFEFNRYLKAVCKKNSEYYKLDNRALDFLAELDCTHLVGDDYLMKAKEWDRQVYQGHMNVFREWIASDKENILNALNTGIFMEDWEKYASGTISAWEMEVLCFYYHEHELAHVNQEKYGFADFYSLDESPEVDYVFKKGDKEIPIFKLERICGTCIAKNKTKSTVTILTNTGVVTVKFRKEYFSLFDKQISARQPDGTKKIMEKSWFNRGNMIVVTGVRNGDNFVSKKYASTIGHQLYRIESILPDGDLVLQDSRYQGEMEDE